MTSIYENGELIRIQDGYNQDWVPFVQVFFNLNVHLKLNLFILICIDANTRRECQVFKKTTEEKKYLTSLLIWFEITHIYLSKKLIQYLFSFWVNVFDNCLMIVITELCYFKLFLVYMTSIKKNVNLTALHRFTINSVPMHLFLSTTSNSIIQLRIGIF